MKPVIAIDGTAGSGKGALAKAIAADLGFAYLDTGKLYRYVGCYCAQHCDTHPNEDIAHEAINHLMQSDVQKLSEMPELLQEDVGELASLYSAQSSVRDALFDLQRNFAKNSSLPGAVLDGRDIGTVICPEASVKIFVDAKSEIRAQRRTAQLQAAGIPAIYAQVLHTMQQRDQRDTSREQAPLKTADDAVILDTSDDTLQQSLQKVMHHIKACLRA
ncbi:MAG: (d)CMP kinase [Pseudomonadota bacterium]